MTFQIKQQFHKTLKKKRNSTIGFSKCDGMIVNHWENFLKNNNDKDF